MDQHLANRSLDDLLNILVTFQEEEGEDGYFFAVPKNIYLELIKRGVKLVRYVGRSKPMAVVCGKVYGVTGEENGKYVIYDDSGKMANYDCSSFELINSKS